MGRCVTSIVATDVSIRGGFGRSDRQSAARDVVCRLRSLVIALLVAARFLRYLVGVSA
jgi:hypothetical protein